MKITIGVTGSISAYKSASLVSALSKEHEVNVIMTKNATNFITPLTLETLSKNKVMIDEFENSNPKFVEHIEYGQNVDLLVIVPATANIIGKIANGIADDLLSSTVLAATCDVLICPAMNEKMYLNKIVQDNIKKLKSYNYIITISNKSQVFFNTFKKVLTFEPIYAIITSTNRFYGILNGGNHAKWTTAPTGTIVRPVPQFLYVIYQA